MFTNSIDAAMTLTSRRPHSPAARGIDLVKAYGTGEVAVRALNGVSVEFERGRFTAVMGPSGSGKSTLMHCMAGLDVPSSGRAFVGEDEIGRLDDAALTQLRGAGSGSCSSPSTCPTLTAAENITLAPDLGGTPVDREWFGALVNQLGIADRLGQFEFRGSLSTLVAASPADLARTVRAPRHRRQWCRRDGRQ